MAEIKGLFFDLDDTLVGTKDANFQAYLEAFGDVGVELTYEDFSKCWGKDSQQFIPEIAPHLTKKEVDFIRRQKSEYYSKYLHTTVANKSLISFLRSMSQHYITVLVTTAKRRNASEILSLHDLEALFAHTVFGDEVKKGKPDPEPYLKAISLTGLGPDEIIVFEDSKNGIIAARAAGLSVMHIRNFA